MSAGFMRSTSCFTEADEGVTLKGGEVCVCVCQQSPYERRACHVCSGTALWRHQSQRDSRALKISVLVRDRLQRRQTGAVPQTGRWAPLHSDVCRCSLFFSCHECVWFCLFTFYFHVVFALLITSYLRFQCCWSDHDLVCVTVCVVVYCGSNVVTSALQLFEHESRILKSATLLISQEPLSLKICYSIIFCVLRHML